MSTARRLALAVAFILTRYASGTAASVITERGNAPGALAAYSGEATGPLDSSCSGPLYARTDGGTTPLEAELVRFAVPLPSGGTRPADFLIARDPRNGLTSFRLIVIGDRAFEEARQVMHDRVEQWRFAEHGERIYRFGLGMGVEVDEFAETHPSLRVAEKEAETWLAHHPEMMKLNSIIVPKRHVEYPPQLGGSFFNGSADSRPQSPILRDVVREGDHWLVAIEGPSHQIATLAINDRDQLIDVRLETRKVPQ